MAVTDFHSAIEFKKLAGSGFSVLSKNCNSKLKPGLDICCLDCGKYFRFKWQLNEHARVHENKIHLKCHQCSSTFIRTGDLNKHLSVHSSDRPFKCKFCSKYFKTKPTKICHEDTHNQNTYNCRYCGDTFKRYNHKNKHERTHRQAEIIKEENGVLKYKCMFCIGIFASHEFLEEHVVKAHKKKSTSNNRKVKPKVYKCSVCSVKLYTYKEHKAHVMDVHPDEFKNVFFETCKICMKKVSSSFLSYHMKAHEGVKPHYCIKCNAKFARRGELNKHMVVHNESKIYPCNWCEDILKTKQDFESHKLLHIGKKRFKCDECDATYHTSSNLRQHKKRWHIRSFAVCSVCQKKVLTMDLNRHMKINHENNEKLCDHCGITFLNEFKLKKHLSHLQNSTKENIDKVSHPYYRYEGSNELPFNSTSKPRNYIFRNKKNKYTKISSNIFKCKSSTHISALKRNMFIGECAICGFSSSSRLGLKYHLQNKKVRLRLRGVEDHADEKELAMESKSSSTRENNFNSKNCHTALSNPLLQVIKQKLKESTIVVKPTKEVSWIVSHNLLKKNNISNCEAKIVIDKLEHKNVKYLCQLSQTLQTVVNNFSLNNFTPSAPTNVRFHSCQTCTKSNAVVIDNNGKNDAIIFKCYFCKTFNHLKNSRTEVASEFPLIPTVNKSKSSESPTGPIFLMGPVASAGVANSLVPVQISKRLPQSKDSDITINNLSSLQNHSSRYTVKNTRKILKNKKIIKQHNSREYNLTSSLSSSLRNLNKNVIITSLPSSPCENKSDNTSDENGLTYSGYAMTANLTDDLITNQLNSSCDISEDIQLSMCKLSSINNQNVIVSNDVIQRVNIKKELAAIKGKQVLSIEELEKLRGYDVDTLLNYLRN